MVAKLKFFYLAVHFLNVHFYFQTLCYFSVCAKKPHIVFILADDLGFNDLGYHNSRVKTPVIDELAREGVRLENYYVQPICTPTRSQLLSGRYQIHTGLQHNIVWPSQANALPKNETTIAEKLREYGYKTHMVGKWHVGFYKREFRPRQRGFDTFFGYLTGAEDYYSHINGMGYPASDFERLNGFDLWRNEEPATDLNGTYSTLLYARETQRIIADHDQDQPLFLYLAFQAVHAPLQVPKEYLKPYFHIKDDKRRTYLGMVTCMDEAIGNVTQALKDKGLWENSVLVFSTDNGGQILYGGNNWPLRGWKASLWEGGIRAVGFVSSPLFNNTKRISRDLIHVTDWFPTFVKLAGGTTEEMSLDGFDVWETLNAGKPSPRYEILINIDPIDSYDTAEHYHKCRHAGIRVGDWKLLVGCPGNSSWVPPPEFDYNYKQDFSVRHSEKDLFLFNITHDPCERNDLSKVYPFIVDQLLSRIEVYNGTAVPVRYPPPDPKSKPQYHGGKWVPWVD